MEARLLRGRDIAEGLKDQIKNELSEMKQERAWAPKLVSVQIGDDSSSEVYAQAQCRAAGELGIECVLKRLPEKTTQAIAEDAIDLLNTDKMVTGIMIQFPVPDHIDSGRLVNAVSPDKDVEGLHPLNLGKILLDDSAIVPCTANACMALIKSTGVDLRGKEVVIVGHSPLVGKPLALLLMSELTTVAVCHVATSERGNLEGHVRRAEILIVAVGKPGLIKGEWIKEGAIVIDVGINRTKAGIVGDIEFETAKEAASYITPVPGGVGPLTTFMLMRNVINAYKENH